jgi:phosphate transport system permease protein
MTTAVALDFPHRPPARWPLTRICSYAFSGVAVAFILTMVLLMVWQSIPVWKHSGVGFLIGKNWFYRATHFGALPMLYGTAVVAIIALLAAAPIALGAAMFTSEYLPPKVRLGFKIVIELLAGIPSVVYGLLGILFLRDWIYHLLTPFDPLSGDTLLTAGLLLAVMILPTIMTLADDAFRDVPAAQRTAARGLGVTKTEAVLSITLPQARSGLLAAVLLGLGRALGETIAVFLVVGRQDNQLPNQPWSLQSVMEAGQTLTSKLGGAETNIAYGDPLHWAAMVGLGLMLMLIVGVVTWLGAWLEERAHA